MLGLGTPDTVHVKAIVSCSDIDCAEATSITLGRSIENIESNEDQFAGLLTLYS